MGVPVTPTAQVATAAFDQVDLSWVAADIAGDFIGYGIYRSLASALSPAQIATVDDVTLSYSDATAVNGTDYVYHVTSRHDPIGHLGAAESLLPANIADWSDPVFALGFTPEQIESADPDSWTGKPTSIVYEPTSDVATWLAARGKTVFSASTGAEQAEALLNATEAAEDLLRQRVRGVGLQEGQSLYLPAVGAYEHTGNLIPTSGDLLLSRPVKTFLEGVRLIAEYMSDGTWLPNAGTGASSKKRERTRVYEVERFEGRDPEGIAEQHRDVWRKISAILPRLL